MKLRIFLAILVAAFVLPAVPAQGAAEEGAEPNVTRLSGNDRIESAIKYSQDVFVSVTPEDDNKMCLGGEQPLPANRAVRLVLANAYNFADALPGGALAAFYRGPLLYTGAERLDPRTRAEILRVIPKNPFCGLFLMGGLSQISQAIEDEINGMGISTMRLSGSNRYATSVRTSSIAFGGDRKVYLLADGNNFPDALSAAGVAGYLKGSILLTNGSQLDTSVARELRENPSTPVIAIGGNAARAYPQAQEKIAGTNRFHTSQLVAQRFGGNTSTCLASGVDYADALAAAPHCYFRGGTFVLTAPESIPAESRTAIEQKPPTTCHGYIYGGEKSVSANVENELSKLVLCD